MNFEIGFIELLVNNLTPFLSLHLITIKMPDSMDFKNFASSLNEAYKDHVFKKIKKDYTTLVQSYRELVMKSSFGKQLPSLFASVMKYEDPIAQEAALDSIDLERIYQGVDDRTNEQEQKKKSGDKLEVEWGYTDFIVLELLKWYKHDFFKWTNEPEATPAQGKPRLVRIEAPSPQEARDGNAGRTEIYQCEDGTIIRYPRYNDPVKLLSTRNGRCGEWANCFCLLLRALGIRTRYVWNAEDHVWCEVYSESQKRWIHVDSCEEAYDNPTLYNRGWGKKMSYVLAFGIDGAVDVSPRYIVDKDKKLPRDKITENDLTKILRFLTVNQRKDRSKDEIYRLEIEDAVEEMELNGLKPSYTQSDIVQPRQTGSEDWKTQRGENGE